MKQLFSLCKVSDKTANTVSSRGGFCDVGARNGTQQFISCKALSTGGRK